MNRKQKFFLWKLGLTIISFIVVFWIKSNIDWSNLSNNYIDLQLCREIVYDLSIGVFSAMILIWFIDEISDRIQDKSNKDAEIKRIQRADRILQKYIERYEVFFYCVVTPIENRDFENIEMPSDFSFKDMSELYLTTMLISEGVFDSSIECFCKAETQLRDEIKLTLRDVDFNYFPEIRERLLEFVEVSLKHDQKKAWIEAKKTVTNKKTLADDVKIMLETLADDRYREIKNGENEYPHNLIHTYIALYEMLKEERKILLEYKSQIENLNREENNK